MGLTNTTYLTLPYPPSENGLYVPLGRGRLVLSKAGRMYHAAVLAKCLEKRVRKIEGPVSVEVKAFPPDSRRRDLANLEKALYDGLTKAGVWDDDSQIQTAFLQFGPPSANPRVEVNVRPWSGWYGADEPPPVPKPRKAKRAKVKGLPTGLDIIDRIGCDGNG